MTTTPAPATLAAELNLVTANLRTRGWTRGTFTNDAGKVCAHGAVRTCQGLQPGDEQIIRALMTHQGLTFDWNDSKASGVDEVADRIAAVDTADPALEACFGPQWSEVVALVRQAAALDAKKIKDLSAAWDAAWAAAGAAAWAAAGDAAWAAAWSAAWAAARDAAWAAAGDAARDAAWAAARAAAWAAALGLVTRDLIGTNGYSKAHYDLLIGPWRAVVGPLHADDEQVQA